MRLPTVCLPKIRKVHVLRVSRATAQLLTSLPVILFGAWLIGWWMVGVVLMVGGGLVGVDAVLRDDDASGRKSAQVAHEDVLERYRRAR